LLSIKEYKHIVRAYNIIMDTQSDISKIRARIFEINMELASRSYSQSDPGAMMNRRLLRKELEKLETKLTTIVTKK
jgi:hypothetical protein